MKHKRIHHHHLVLIGILIVVVSIAVGSFVLLKKDSTKRLTSQGVRQKQKTQQKKALNQAGVSPIPVQNLVRLSNLQTTGDKNVLVLPVSFKDNPTQYVSKTEIQNVMSQHVVPFYVANSYKNLTLHPTVADWKQMSDTTVPTGCLFGDTLLSSALVAHDASFNYQTYNNGIIILVAPGYQSPGGITCDANEAARSQNGPLTVNTPDGPITVGVSTIFREGIVDASPQSRAKTIAHEIAHTLGFPSHANAMMCDGKPLNPEHLPFESGCTFINAGDGYDVMSLSVLGTTNPPLHMNMTEKEWLGWTKQGHIEKIGPADQGIFTLLPVSKVPETPSDVSPRQIQIFHDGYLYDWDYTIEYRLPGVPYDNAQQYGALIRLRTYDEVEEGMTHVYKVDEVNNITFLTAGEFIFTKDYSPDYPSVKITTCEATTGTNAHLTVAVNADCPEDGGGSALRPPLPGNLKCQAYLSSFVSTTCPSGEPRCTMTNTSNIFGPADDRMADWKRGVVGFSEAKSQMDFRFDKSVPSDAYVAFRTGMSSTKSETSGRYFWSPTEPNFSVSPDGINWSSPNNTNAPNVFWSLADPNDPNKPVPPPTVNDPSSKDFPPAWWYQPVRPPGGHWRTLASPPPSIRYLKLYHQGFGGSSTAHIDSVCAAWEPKLYLPVITKEWVKGGLSLSSRITVANGNSQSSSVTIRLRKTDGSTPTGGTLTKTIGARSSHTFLLSSEGSKPSDFPALAKGFKGSAVVTSDLVVSAVADIGYPSTTGTAASVYEAYEGVSPMGASVFFPNAFKSVSGNKLFTEYGLMNTGSQATTVRAVFTGPDPDVTVTFPQSIPAGGVFFYDLEKEPALILPPSGTGVSTPVTFTSTNGQSLAVVSLQYSLDGAARKLTALTKTVGFSVADQDSRQYLPNILSKLSNGMSVSHFVANSGGSDVTVAMEYKTDPASQNTATIPMKTKLLKAQEVWSFNPVTEPSFPTNWSGSAIARAQKSTTDTMPVSSIISFTNQRNTQNNIMTGANGKGKGNTSPKALCPLFTHGIPSFSAPTRQTSTIQVQNVSGLRNVSVKLTFLPDSHSSQTIVIPPQPMAQDGDRITLNGRDTKVGIGYNLPPNWRGSVLVESTNGRANVAAVVNLFSGVTGAGDLMGSYNCVGM